MENVVKIYMTEDNGEQKFKFWVDVEDEEVAASMALEAYATFAEKIIKTHNCSDPKCDVVDVNYRLVKAIKEIVKEHQARNAANSK